MSTLHTASNFDPQDYVVIDYLDNKRPTFNPSPFFSMESQVKNFEKEVEDWEKACKMYFGENFYKPIKYCAHCNRSGHVRYIAVVEHLPTKTNMAFGYTCAERLNFATKEAFRLQISKKNCMTSIQSAMHK
jgi:hypothetical protein